MSTSSIVDQTPTVRDGKQVLRDLVALLDHLPAPQEITIREGMTYVSVKAASTADFDAWAAEFGAKPWSRDERHNNTIQCHANLVTWDGWQFSIHSCVIVDGE